MYLNFTITNQPNEQIIYVVKSQFSIKWKEYLLYRIVIMIKGNYAYKTSYLPQILTTSSTTIITTTTMMRTTI